MPGNASRQQENLVLLCSSIACALPLHPAVCGACGLFVRRLIWRFACRAPNSDWGAAAVRTAQPATNNPFASPDVPETAPNDGFGESAFGAPPAAGGADGGFGDSAFGEKPAFGADCSPGRLGRLAVRKHLQLHKACEALHAPLAATWCH